MIRCFALFVALFVSAPLWAVDGCPTITYPLPNTEQWRGRHWTVMDGASVVNRHAPWNTADGTIPTDLVPGWQRLYEVASQPDTVDSTMFVISAPVETLHPEPLEPGQRSTGQGCVTYTYGRAWLDEETIRANIDSLNASAQIAGTPSVSYGSLTGQTDAQAICARAAGVASRIRRGESITDPGEADADGWCAAWSRDIASPNDANARALKTAIIAARTASLSGTPTDPPDPSTGWTHTPALYVTPEGLGQ